MFDYYLIEVRDSHTLQNDVVDWAKRGYKLQGGASVYRDDIGNTWYCQAIVKIGGSCDK